MNNGKKKHRSGLNNRPCPRITLLWWPLIHGLVGLKRVAWSSEYSPKIDKSGPKHLKLQQKQQTRCLKTKLQSSWSGWFFHLFGFSQPPPEPHPPTALGRLGRRASTAISTSIALNSDGEKAKLQIPVTTWCLGSEGSTKKKNSHDFLIFTNHFEVWIVMICVFAFDCWFQASKLVFASTRSGGKVWSGAACSLSIPMAISAARQFDETPRFLTHFGQLESSKIVFFGSCLRYVYLCVMSFPKEQKLGLSLKHGATIEEIWVDHIRKKLLPNVAFKTGTSSTEEIFGISRGFWSWE